MPYTRRNPTISLSVSRKDGYQSMMKSVLEKLRPEPRPKMWQKPDTEGIMYKEFVPTRQAVNVKLYCEFRGD
jgi:hypothetical protein